jgi:hypothetical protein
MSTDRYHLRNRGNPNNATMPEENVVGPNMIALTNEQFQQLLQGFRGTNPAPTVAGNNFPASGNFSKCQTRFDGKPTSDVNAFIDGLEIYKNCVNISDENAVRGLPMLLDGFAASWYQGVKATVTTWDEGLTLLRSTFGARKPPHRVYRELFAKDQDNKVATNVFVCKARAILSHLPAGTLSEEIQLDMVYGLLNVRIRERIPRDKVTSFTELLDMARGVEETFAEKRDPTSEAKTATIVRCAYCKNAGHTKEECQKLAKRNSSAAAPTKVVPPKEIAKTAPSSTLKCFGCGKVGYTITNCPQCSSTPGSSTSFCTFNPKKNNETLVYPRSRPLFPINILGTQGTGLIDTAAKQSVAGETLYQLLKSKGQVFTKDTMTIKLADGSGKCENILVARVSVGLADRVISTTFIVLPKATNNNTLLGIDFLQDAGICLNINSRTWNFHDKPHVQHKLTFENEEVSGPIELLTFTLLRPDEGASLSMEEKQTFNLLLEKNQDIFDVGGEATPYIEHSIDTGDHDPIAVPPYRMTPPRKEILRNEIERLLKENVIEECESPWAAPVVMVPKKDGSIRLCVDFRRLNAVTVADSYPLPRLDDLIHSTTQAKFMTTIDLRAGYHQINVKSAHRDKTAFVTPFGTFRYIRMPFGLRNAPGTFQRLIDHFRRGLGDLVVLAYLDDIIVLSSCFEKHIADLQCVFDRLRKFKLRANRAKCHFSCATVKYLGHLITQDGIQVDPEKVTAITQRSEPQNAKQVLSFLQTCSWYRKFIENFAEISRPLSELTRKSAIWKWESAQQNAFDKLKVLLASAPTLKQNDPKSPYVLKTDASNYALGAVLTQRSEDGEHPIEYASRTLNQSEINYSTTEKEALAVVWALDKFRGYVEGSPVTVISDHQPLKWLLSLKSPSGRLARWALRIQGYDLKIDYVPGRQNLVADTLSRPPCKHAEDTACDVCTVTVDVPTRSPAEIRAEQKKDPELLKIIDSFESNHDDFSKWTERGYVMANGILHRYSGEEDVEDAQLVVPSHERPRLMQDYHDAPTAGHYGVERTLQRIAHRYYFTGMRRYVTEYLKNCADCQRYKASTQKPAGLVQTPAYNRRFEVLSVDLFGPLPETPTGEKWIFIVEDTATKWVELFGLTRATADECARVLINQVFFRYGLPRQLISDNGVQFVSSVMQHICDYFSIKQSLIPLYHPQANMVERKNRDLKPRLAILVGDDHTSWMERLPVIRFAMNTASSETTGHTAAFLTFARELRTPDQVNNDPRAIPRHENLISELTPYLRRMTAVWNEARERHDIQQDRHKVYADQRRREEPPFNIGDLVWVALKTLSKAAKGVTNKFHPKRDGPYRICHQVSPTTYSVANPSTPEEIHATYHVSSLTPYTGPDTAAPVVGLRKRGRPRKNRI